MADSDMGGMCSCDIDGDPPDVYSREIRKANKEHRCYECNKPITPGVRYEHVSALYEGSWATYRTHLACAGIRRDFCCNMHGAVAETFEQTYGFDPRETAPDDDKEEG